MKFLKWVQIMTNLKCPNCGSEKVTLTAEQMFMANTDEHYCHSVKPQDANAKSTCLDCDWEGTHAQLDGYRKAAN